MKIYWYYFVFIIIMTAPSISPVYSQNYIDSLHILPVNPFAADTVKLICATNFPNSDCNLDSSVINMDNHVIEINAFYSVGDLTVPCQSLDTIPIGNLSTGAYSIIYYAHNTSTVFPYEFDVDSLYISISTNIRIIDNSWDSGSIEIFPNPFSSFTNIRFECERQDLPLNYVIYDLLGKEVQKNIIVEKEAVIFRNDLKGGVYILSISNNSNINYNTKLTIEN